ncbi:MAG: FprA family A-type flavoprotein [Oscillospiraceae bacterium]|jgi:flavorubredoxin|nr:FprA family A-type flavoprotein [Oscillospiraceae bacterium]
MHYVRQVTDDLYWVGANDHRLTLFENIFPIPDGVSYNSYLLLDQKTVLFDTVDWSVCRLFLENIEHLLNGKSLDYVVINHIEPDHGASLEEILTKYPKAKIITSPKAVMLMRQFGYHIDGRTEEVNEGDTKSFGKHVVKFIAAPMIHWPEVMVTFDTTNGVLFSADAFGSFKALDGKLFNDEVNYDRDWIDEARRYYTNIVGKYGPFVQKLLKKASGINIKMICPLHGLVWRSHLGYFLDKYDKWSRYEPEEKGVLIVYSSMYGNTENAVGALAGRIVEKGMPNVTVYDVSKTDVSYLISETFRMSHLVLASVTYNLGIYPPMKNLLMDMKALNVQNRTAALVENGSWACRSGTLMRKFLEDEMKDMNILDEKLTINSSLSEDNVPNLELLADSIIQSMK